MGGGKHARNKGGCEYFILHQRQGDDPVLRIRLEAITGEQMAELEAVGQEKVKFGERELQPGRDTERTKEAQDFRWQPIRKPEKAQESERFGRNVGPWLRQPGAKNNALADIASICQGSHMRGKHRETLELVFRDPVSGAVEWPAEEALLICPHVWKEAVNWAVESTRETKAAASISFFINGKGTIRYRLRLEAITGEQMAELEAVGQEKVKFGERELQPGRDMAKEAQDFRRSQSGSAEKAQESERFGRNVGPQLRQPCACRYCKHLPRFPYAGHGTCLS